MLSAKNSPSSSPVSDPPITDVIGRLPYRLALAGGWIDQPFVSRHNPTPPGSMVVVGLQPTFWYMTRTGLGTSTRSIAARLWQDRLPDRPPAELVKELYDAENQGRADPSGSQDMIGLIYPGVNRLDYVYEHENGLFPQHIESNTDPAVLRWLEGVIYLLPINQRPNGYTPLGVFNADPGWIQRLGQTGKDCYAAIIGQDIHALGASMNECMQCWETILPYTVHHPTLTVDLMAILHYYQARYPGAMYSGCGGGYLFVVSEEPVPGGLRVTLRGK